MEYTIINSGENLTDVAIRVYGHIQGLMNLIKDNGFNFSSDINPGTEIIIDESVDYSELKKLNISGIMNEVPQELIIEPGQNIYDLAIIQFGSIEGVFELIRRNNLSLSGIIKQGSILDASGDLVEKLIADYWKGKKNKPATGSDIKIDNEPVLEGIGYWAIENNFIVS